MRIFAMCSLLDEPRTSSRLVVFDDCFLGLGDARAHVWRLGGFEAAEFKERDGAGGVAVEDVFKGESIVETADGGVEGSIEKSQFICIFALCAVLDALNPV